MKRFWSTYGSGLVMMMALAGASQAHAQSLAESVKLAVDTNPKVDAMVHNREAVDSELRRARGLYLPQLDVRSSIGPEYTENILTQGTSGQHMRNELSAVLSQKIYDGGATSGQVDNQIGRAKSAAFRVRENAEDVGLDAVEAHLDVVRLRHVLKFAEDNVQAHQGLLGRIQQRSKGGAGRGADVAQAQSRLERATAERDETRGLLQDAEAHYLEVVGRPPGSLEDAPPPVGALTTNIQAALAEIQAHNPTVRARQADIEAAQGNVEVADARFDPTVSLEVGGDHDHDVGGFPGRDNEARALLVLRWNLYAGGSDIANRQAAFAQVAEAKSVRLEALREAEEHLRQAQAAYDAAGRRVPQLQNAVQHDIQARDAYNQEYQVSQRSLLDLLDSQSEVFQAQTQLATAQGQLSYNAYRILAIEGMLLSSLNVPAPPAADYNHLTVPPTRPKT